MALYRRTMATCLILASMVVVGGCDPFSQPVSMMDEYVERLARVLEEPAEFSAVIAGSQLPRRRYRRLEMPELDINMLDFLSLYGCELQHVVGERNSVMGRVMQPLNQMRYELRFITAARECLPEISDETLRTAVKEAIDSKIGSLPVAVWNASWGGEEIESLVTLAKGPIPIDLDPSRVAQLSADLAQLNSALAAILAGEYQYPTAGIGVILQRWQSEHLVGQLIVSAHLAIARLDDAIQLLQSRIQGRPLCFRKQPGSQAKLVQGVLFNVYGREIQPYLAQIRRVRDALIPSMAVLAERQVSVMPVQFLPWYSRTLTLEGRLSIWTELDKAMARHTESWQRLMAQCGLEPG